MIFTFCTLQEIASKHLSKRLGEEVLVDVDVVQDDKPPVVTMVKRGKRTLVRFKVMI